MGERVGAGADPGAGSGDGRGWLERELIERADGMERMGRMGRSKSPLIALLHEAAAALGEYRRAIEASRVWWDDTDPYHAKWDHSRTCWPGHECAACVARRLAMAALGETGGGG